MDESEKLIALVALGTPSQAVKAWNLWNEKNSKKEASTILSWSGGYMYHNLEKAGYEDKYLLKSNMNLMDSLVKRPGQMCLDNSLIKKELGILKIDFNDQIDLFVNTLVTKRSKLQKIF